MKNYKTTLAGVAAMLSAVADVLHGVSTGTPVNWTADVAAFWAGVGLLFAHDAPKAS